VRRALLIVIGITAAAVIAVLLTGSGSSSFKVDAEFDTAKSMAPGQLVEIGGAKVGTVATVKLERTPGGGYAALMTLSIDHRFRPFHANASCHILPQGLISENYIECDPGSPSAGSLRPGPAGVPTVPRAQTTASASLQDVLDTFSLPTDQRLAFVLDTLGIGTAGRGEDLNGILLRANPALTEARNVLSIVDAQNHQLAGAVSQTDLVLGQLAANRSQVRAFVDRSASVVRNTAARSGPLGAAVQRLPQMLDAVRGGLQSIERVTSEGVPLLDDLRASAPGLANVTQVLPALTQVAVPALRSVGTAAAAGRRAIGPALPVVSHLASLAHQAVPVVSLLDKLLVNTRDTGGIEGLNTFLYDYAAFTAPYDSLSHVSDIVLTAFPECVIANTLRTNSPGCRHSYNSPGMGLAPINDPTVNPGPLTAALHKVPSVSGTAPITRAKDPPVRQLRALLGYLLK
jgi:phospholipid/cholesterol/gamma-HCH transport system substrate-binding protein